MPTAAALAEAGAVMTTSGRQLRVLCMQECDDWGKENYCNSNPRFMWYACRKTCSSCFRPDLQVCSRSCAWTL